MNRAQQRKFWAALSDISEQVKWPVNGEMTLMHRDDWRLVFAAAHVKEQRIARGLEGGYVVLGMRLRDIFKGLEPAEAIRQASELIELVNAFGNEHGVCWSDPETLSQEAAHGRN